jgi:biopolymer transport protein TolQ
MESSELSSYQTFDSHRVACYASVIALSQRRTDDSQASFTVEARLRTLGSYALLLYAQGGAAPQALPPEVQTDVVSLVVRSGPVAKIVLFILLLFSAVSWGVILYKLFQFRRARAHSNRFIDVFRRSSKFSEVQAVCKALAASPLVGLFQAGYTELNGQLRQPHGNPEARPAGPAPRPTLKSLDAVDRALLRASTVEVARLERRVTFLATTASITPFIGLFGTVWGIMTSFQGIAAQGSSSLGVVAPGIADALVATAAGLFAAIPAVYFYNHLTSRVKRFAADMDDFSLEFLNIAERNFT